MDAKKVEEPIGQTELMRHRVADAISTIQESLGIMETAIMNIDFRLQKIYNLISPEVEVEDIYPPLDQMAEMPPEDTRLDIDADIDDENYFG
jgi:hypothetical protein